MEVQEVGMPVVKVSSGLDRIMDASQDVEELGSGFCGQYGPPRVRVVERGGLPPLQRHPQHPPHEVG